MLIFQKQYFVRPFENSNTNNEEINMSKKDDAWNNANEIKGQNPDVWRKDAYGNKIRYGSYGTQGDYGWEIDHKHPVSKGGTDSPRNLQALYWEENRQKGNKYPY